MKLTEKKATIDRYNERLTIYGYDPRTLGWFKGRQPIRFKVLSEIGELVNSSVLDVGCGFGDLYGFLVEKGISMRYTGYDINPELIEVAREVYAAAHFEVVDIEEADINDEFDWVFESGVFNFRLSDNQSFIKGILRRMFELCNKGVAADFMSAYVDFEKHDQYYAKPEEIFAFCKTLSKRVTVRHDYMPFEFCVYIYKDDSISERNVFTAFD